MASTSEVYSLFPECKRTNVKVTAEWDEHGLIIPTKVHWRDGRVFDLRMTNRVNRPAQKVGGCGVRYTVIVSYRGKPFHNNPTYLFYERGANPEVWFVEEELPFD